MITNDFKYYQDHAEVNNEQWEIEGMKSSEIKYGDSVCFIQHTSSEKWLSYQVYTSTVKVFL